MLKEPVGPGWVAVYLSLDQLSAMGFIHDLPLHSVLLDHLTLVSALQNTLVLGFTYLVSLVVYRLFFHPLANYPGPFLAKITDW